jgi:5-methylcytosine-specific restriction endonuclease McrA
MKNVNNYNQFKELHCVVCGHSGDEFNPLDVDHIKTRGSGGRDVDWNCWTQCRRHHIEKGQIGLIKFAERWPRAKEWLVKNGWEIDEYTGKWTHA